MYGPALWERIRPSEVHEPREPSPELADEAMERYEELLRGERDEARFTPEELESLLRYRAANFLPDGAADPSVRLEGGEAAVTFRVGLERLPRLPELEGLREILPDSVQVGFRGLLLTLEGGNAIFLPRQIDVHAVPLPRRLHGRIFEVLNLPTGEDVPPGAVRVPLPPGVRSAYIEQDRLALIGLDESS